MFILSKFYSLTNLMKKKKKKTDQLTTDSANPIASACHLACCTFNPELTPIVSLYSSAPPTNRDVAVFKRCVINHEMRIHGNQQWFVQWCGWLARRWHYILEVHKQRTTTMMKVLAIQIFSGKKSFKRHKYQSQLTFCIFICRAIL